MSTSPPTDRVIAIVELLLDAEDGAALSEISERLGLNRATCAAVLGALEHHGWAERGEDRAYRAGAGLVPIAGAVLARVPVVDGAQDLLRELSAATGLAASLSRVAADHTSVVASSGRGRPGPADRTRLPIFPPFGAVVMAFRTPAERREWLARTPDPAAREHLDRFLATVRAEGVGIWRLDDAMEQVTEAIRTMSALTGRSDLPQMSAFLRRIGRGYLSGELQNAETLPVSYMAAPVFGHDGRPRYEVELHLLRPDAPRAEVRTLATHLTDVANQLTTLCGGHPPTPSPS
ncbi:IclR family transcriptional regulator [Yinghuangia soli]|uniref:Helix-turn-helix domain-containing protein n=1 Tax=Yinghuangia soli TaxID=2908204 RepID=A0AA41U3K9_9ACTN|nr:helix-turn-helix domain-containing protein [Yinghuangia soli]MCF2532858.1 helix-turn-helix domain-containing protein [Yinghuangia soli]